MSDMTEWCNCNKLMEAEEKAAKWDAIVRCRECKFFSAGNKDYAVRDYCGGLAIYVEPDFFCKLGERREA